MREHIKEILLSSKDIDVATEQIYKYICANTCRDFIKYYYKGQLIYEAPIPEGSTQELREAILKSGYGDIEVDRMVIYKGEQSRLAFKMEDGSWRWTTTPPTSTRPDAASSEGHTDK